MIFVFLSGKLITLDTIAPLLQDLKFRAPDTRFELICFEKLTEDAIRENVVLYDVVRKLGPLRMLGRWSDNYWQLFLHRLWVAGALIRIASWLLHPRTRFVHFKALNEWPLHLLYLLSPSRTILVQGTASGYAPLEKRTSELMKERKYSKREPAGRYVIQFDESWPFLEISKRKRTVRRAPPPFTLQSWVQSLQDNEGKYLTPALRSAGLQGDEQIAVIVLTWMGESNLLRVPSDFPALLSETLESMSEVCSELPIFIKPHPATRPKERAIIDSIIHQYRSRSKIIITHLHPMMLAIRARLALGNAYSTTFSSFRFFNVPTIEYSDYAPAILLETKGGSMRPDFVTDFVNRDREALKSVIRRYSNLPKGRVPVAGVTTLPQDVLVQFLGQQAASTPL